MKSTNEISISDNVMCDTSFLGILKISGVDASAFLQGQFSNDVNLLSDNNSQLNSYNSPKGRMYASFRLFKLREDFYMLLPKEIIDIILKRLRMFIMRSKVTIDDLSDSWETLGLSGAMTAKIKTFPETLNGAHHDEETSYIHLPGVEKRLLITGPSEDIAQVKNNLTETFTRTDSSHWKRLDIHAGLANIYTTTQENFVAQMVNLQLIDGVSFTKGCYPGQEVVARMHYLGKLKKRMYRIIIHSNTAPKPGDNLYLSGNENAQSIGQIVDAQLNEKNNIDALAVIQARALDGEVLVNGAKVSIADLPYTFE